MATIKRFEDLLAWQKARLLAFEIYRLTKNGELARDFGLRNQIRRAAGSVMDNIAEGFDRGSRGEFVQFLGIAKGSAGEVKSQLYRALDQQYITESEANQLLSNIDELTAIMKGLLTYLNKSNLRGERYQKLEEPAVEYLPFSEEQPQGHVSTYPTQQLETRNQKLKNHENYRPDGWHGQAHAPSHAHCS